MVNIVKCVRVIFIICRKSAAQIVSKRSDDFKEKFQPQLGKVLDP